MYLSRGHHVQALTATGGRRGARFVIARSQKRKRSQSILFSSQRRLQATHKEHRTPVLPEEWTMRVDSRTVVPLRMAAVAAWPQVWNMAMNFSSRKCWHAAAVCQCRTSLGRGAQGHRPENRFGYEANATNLRHFSGSYNSVHRKMFQLSLVVRSQGDSRCPGARRAPVQGYDSLRHRPEGA